MDAGGKTMAETTSKKKGHVDRVACPVAGHTVTCTSKYKPGEEGEDSLSYFACTMEGHCGITMWDPCPLFISYLENKIPKEKK